METVLNIKYPRNLAAIIHIGPGYIIPNIFFDVVSREVEQEKED